MPNEAADPVQDQLNEQGQPVNQPQSQDAPVEPTVAQYPDPPVESSQRTPDPQQQAPPAEPSQPKWSSVRDAASEFGYDLSSYEDDESAMKALVRQAQEAERLKPFAEYGQKVVPHAGEFERWLQENAQQQQQEPEQPKFWDAPEWNPQWLTQVERDPTSGELRPVNGGTMETVARVQRYSQYLQDQRDKFWSDPFSYFQPYLDHREQNLQEKVQELVQQQLAQTQTARRAETFIEKNADWLFEKNPSGGIATDAQGRQRLSAEGQQFAGYVQEAADLGVPEEKQERYAMRLLEADRKVKAPATNGGANPNGAKPKSKDQSFLERAAGFNPTEPASTNKRPDANGNAPSQNPGLNLRDLLRAAFKENGVTDKDIASTY